MSDETVSPDDKGEGAPPAKNSNSGEATRPPASDPKPPSSGSKGDSSGWRPSYVFLAVVTILNLAADIASKQWIKRYFESSHQLRATRKLEIIKGYANLIYATNKGGAWGILQAENESLRRPFFLVVSVAAIVFIISLYRKLTPGQQALKWGLPLVLGGALGNLIDRIVYGWVIDFIDCFAHKGTFAYTLFAGISALFGGVPSDEIHWPTFNVADIAICVGVGLMAVDMFTSRERKSKTVPQAGPKPVPVSSAPVSSPVSSAPVSSPVSSDLPPADG